MSEHIDREPPMERPPVERAEDLLNRLGQRFAQSRAQFSQSLEQRAARAGGDGAAADTRPATERAEEILDRAGERVGTLASNAGFSLRRWLARAREEAEDIWVEARTTSQRGGGGGEPPAEEPRTDN
jgi:hypothetical protein